MNIELVRLSVVLGLVAVVYLAVAAYVWQHRRAAGGRALTVLLLSAGIWTICNAVEVALPDPADQIVWGDIKYIGIVTLPPALLVFALEYTGRVRRVSGALLALLAVEPVVVLTALTVPQTHDLVRSLPADAHVGEYAVAVAGPLFWVHALYSYALVVVAIGLIVVATLAVTRRQLGAWLLIASCVLPVVLNIAYNVGFDEYFPADPTPIGFSIAGFVLVWGFFRFKLSDLVQMGRRQVVEQIPDSVLVLDLHGRIVDANPSATRLTGRRGHALIGRRVLDVLTQLTALLETTPVEESTSGTCRATGPDGVVDLSVTVSPLPGGGEPPSGRLVVLRDVTQQRDVERRLRELVTERTGIIETLRRGLYPLRLPEIPGLEVAATLDPAEAETSIGGDFLDVRSIGSGRWALMLGDVVGKGAGAATLTALARHTTIALTGLGWLPSRVLERVSHAIAEDDSGGEAGQEVRFCTMALATVEPGEDSAEVLLSLGGHPRPMFVTDRGVVTEVGVPGSLLGVIDDPELHDVRLGLRAGEALVMFSDGVTEARRGADAFGEQRLIELLSRLAGTPAAHIVHEVVSAVRAFSAQEEHRDDVAVLVLAIPGAAATPASANPAAG
ncbi:histidine kinase N-terminal 7TM domain-containing protein [Angustibacter luteus]|uniref:Histidine kinase N-terminal 7TM domain-containing protein n=1 Tax=Angustibacter luteus TaxID=658456 RepID=A0ABW1JIS4_9ACTN